MGSQGVLLPLILLYIQGSWAEITLTQTPNEITATPGQTVTVSCKSSADVHTTRLHWYQQKPGQRPTLIIYGTSNLQSGVPARFSGSSPGSGSVYGTDFTLKISDIKDEDDAVYYCQQYQEFPLTFGGGTTVEIKRRENAKPSVFIFRPSVEQITSGSASSVCFVDQFYPGDAKVTWKADNKVITSGVETSDKIKDKDSTYSLSSTLTMPSAEFKKYETFTCEVTHVTLTPALATSFKASECTF